MPAPLLRIVLTLVVGSIGRRSRRFFSPWSLRCSPSSLVAKLYQIHVPPRPYSPPPRPTSSPPPPTNRTSRLLSLDNCYKTLAQFFPLTMHVSLIVSARYLKHPSSPPAEGRPGIARRPAVGRWATQNPLSTRTSFLLAPQSPSPSRHLCKQDSSHHRYRRIQPPPPPLPHPGRAASRLLNRHVAYFILLLSSRCLSTFLYSRRFNRPGFCPRRRLLCARPPSYHSPPSTRFPRIYSLSVFFIHSVVQSLHPAPQSSHCNRIAIYDHRSCNYQCNAVHRFVN